MDKWNPDVYECPSCNSLVYSHYPGHFSMCNCYGHADIIGLAVDQTEHYTRLIGNLDAIHKGKLNDH